MKIALAQLNSSDDVSHNVDVITGLVESAAAVEKPEIIFFPENSLFFRFNLNAEVKALTLRSEEILSLCKLSSKTNTALHLTTALKVESTKEELVKNELSKKESNSTSTQSPIPMPTSEPTSAQKLTLTPTKPQSLRPNIFNASFLIQPNQAPQILYRKIHLFDIALKDQKPIKESDFFAYGAQENIFEYKGFKFGSSICYDVRFSELYLKYARQAVDVILVPAAFLVKTGQAHWDILLRARAIESQCYVLAAAQAGKHVRSDATVFRETYGNSLIVDPWGQIVARKEEGVGLIYAKLDKKQIESVRTQIPMAQHRRL